MPCKIDSVVHRGEARPYAALLRPAPFGLAHAEHQVRPAPRGETFPGERGAALGARDLERPGVRLEDGGAATAHGSTPGEAGLCRVEVHQLRIGCRDQTRERPGLAEHRAPRLADGIPAQAVRSSLLGDDGELAPLRARDGYLEPTTHLVGDERAGCARHARLKRLRDVEDLQAVPPPVDQGAHAFPQRPRHVPGHPPRA